MLGAMAMALFLLILLSGIPFRFPVNLTNDLNNLHAAMRKS